MQNNEELQESNRKLFNEIDFLQLKIDDIQIEFDVVNVTVFCIIQFEL